MKRLKAQELYLLKRLATRIYTEHTHGYTILTILLKSRVHSQNILLKEQGAHTKDLVENQGAHTKDLVENQGAHTNDLAEKTGCTHEISS